MDFRIPTKFSVGGLGYRVDEAESLRYGEEYGHWDGTVMLYYDADLDTPDRVYINESPFENENGAVVIY